jgi:hypothetical protein
MKKKMTKYKKIYKELIEKVIESFSGREEEIFKEMSIHGKLISQESVKLFTRMQLNAETRLSLQIVNFLVNMLEENKELRIIAERHRKLEEKISKRREMEIKGLNYDLKIPIAKEITVGSVDDLFSPPDQESLTIREIINFYLI